MSEKENTIVLQGGEYYITSNPNDAFHVKSGTVLVFIVPLKNGKLGRRSFLFEADEKSVIPAFCYRDMDYCEWRFCFVALEVAEFSIIENGATKKLKEKLVAKAQIKNFETEGYNGGLVDKYRRNIVNEDGFIRRSQQERNDTRERIAEKIYSSFSKNGVNNDIEKSGNLLYDAAAFLCKKSRIPIASFDKIKEACGQKFGMSDIARLSHFAYREILLTPDWRKNDAGAFLVFDSKKKPFVCIPHGSHGYKLYDVENDSVVPVSKKIEETIGAKAYMIYRPFSEKKLTTKELFSFCMQSIRKSDAIWLIILVIATTLIGLLVPVISQTLYDTYIPLGAKAVMFQLGCVMTSFMIANVLFSIVKNIFNFRITSRVSYDVQSALYDRLFNLPESFFRDYESADLANRAMGAGNFIGQMMSSSISFITSMVFLIVYFVRMIGYSTKLSIIGLVMTLVYACLYYLLAKNRLKYTKMSTDLTGKTDSVMFQFLNGISKIRIAGVEDRAILEYIKPYIKLREYKEKDNKIQNYSDALSMAATTIFSVILYFVIIHSSLDISVGSFIAFNSIFGSFSASLLGIIGCIIEINNIKPTYERLRPILETEPETSDDNELPGDISGEIELNNVTFSYSEDSPIILNDIDLHIKPNEYVGIVGSSGCGKSTLLKLLLGFEKPNSGKIYYDNKDIESVDKRELRKKMGVVLQNGKLISGSIFENITITSPSSTLNDVKRVIKAVGLEDDINKMPMGLHTVLSEDCNTISGGQQQRILIARAIISDPKILFFDEATSALDNITQAMVCETLEKMDSTRIVIAHRLSTIMKCDRIIVLDAGRIVEQGTYDELMKNNGIFYQLASRQMA